MFVYMHKIKKSVRFGATFYHGPHSVGGTGTLTSALDYRSLKLQYTVDL